MGSLMYSWWVLSSEKNTQSIREQGNYHVIVYHVYSGEQHPIVLMLLTAYSVDNIRVSSIMKIVMVIILFYYLERLKKKLKQRVMLLI